MQLYYFISILIFFSLFLFHCSLFIIHYLFFNIHCIGKILSMISNQNGVKNKSTTKEEVQRKVDSIILATGVPMDFICALDDDIFKKPRTGKKYICSYIFSFLFVILGRDDVRKWNIGDGFRHFLILQTGMNSSLNDCFFIGEWTKSYAVLTTNLSCTHNI